MYGIGHAEKTVGEKIKLGEYDTKLTWDFVYPPVHDDMTLREAREHEAKKKDAKSEHRRKYNEDEARLCDLFRADLAKEYGLTGHPKEPKVWNMAWDHGHSSGWSNIECWYSDLVDLVL